MLGAAPPPSSSSLLEDLASSFEEWKHGSGRNIVIIRASSAITSTSSSILLVWILFCSRAGLSTTYHRLLLGMSGADVLMSSIQITFGAATPKELGYFVWNARGDEATCTALGFIGVVGATTTLLYSCSINLFFLAQIKFNSTPDFVARRVEPWLHAVPFLYSLAIGLAGVAYGGINADVYGDCFPGAYTPPHCADYDDGQIPEGFHIPCGRGRDVEKSYFVTGLVTLTVPFVVGISLWMIYRTVARQERRIGVYLSTANTTAAANGAGTIEMNRSRETAERQERSTTQYGFGTIEANGSPQTNGDNAAASAEGRGGNEQGDGGRDGVCAKIASALKNGCRVVVSRPGPGDAELSQSRVLLQRAVAYSFSYFVTWIWFVIYMVLTLAGEWPTEFPPPKVVIAFNYVWNFFNPLQGLWNFLIYMHPKGMHVMRTSNRRISFCRAFVHAIILALAGRDNST